jgi:DNA polymerase delta subunit OB-fold domain
MLTAVTMPTDEPIQRLQSTYECSDQFLIKEKVFTQQYSGLYILLMQILYKIEYPATESFGSYSKEMERRRSCLQTYRDQGEGSVLHCWNSLPANAIVTKTNSRKPTVLSEITREAWIVAPPPKDKYTSSEDVYILEDESGRVKIEGDVLKREMILTGMIIGVLGSEV